MYMPQEREAKHFNITAIPELLRITLDAVRSRQSVVLTTGDDAVAVLTPMSQTRVSQMGPVPTWEEIQALQGAAGSLPRPLAWEDVRRIAEEDRADELQRRTEE